MSELERIRAFDRAFLERLAERSVRGRYGTAFFVDRLPRVYWLNAVAVDLGIEASAAELASEADRLQAGLRHRKIAIDDELGAAVEGDFRAAGWRVDRLLIMVHRSDGAELEASVDEVEPGELEPVWAAGIREGEYGRDEDVVRQLVEAQHRRRRAVRVRYFAARVDGRIASYCELFSDGQTAQVESVMTLERFRGRGLGKAIVAHAVREARAAGHSLVFVVADADDWPKELYRRLGFEPVGRIWDFIREPKPARST
jgi:ribosomal protein S18 acetylase RimI-like enzyme